MASSIVLSVGAMLLLSCGEKNVQQDDIDPEKVPSQVSHNHKVLETKNGKKSFKLETPLIEKFDEAKEPFWQFPKGVKAEGYEADRDTIESEIVADYARYNVNKDLWEARGNVVVKNFKDDRTLFTELLFWDRKTQKIYTDKPARILDKGNTHKGIGFSADEKMNSWQFHKGRGSIEVNDSDSTKQEKRDSVTIIEQRSTEEVETKEEAPQSRRRAPRNAGEMGVLKDADQK